MGIGSPPIENSCPSTQVVIDGFNDLIRHGRNDQNHLPLVKQTQTVIRNLSSNKYGCQGIQNPVNIQGGKPQSKYQRIGNKADLADPEPEFLIQPDGNNISAPCGTQGTETNPEPQPRDAPKAQGR